MKESNIYSYWLLFNHWLKKKLLIIVQVPYSGWTCQRQLSVTIYMVQVFLNSIFYENHHCSFLLSLEVILLCFTIPARKERAISYGFFSVLKSNAPWCLRNPGRCFLDLALCCVARCYMLLRQAHEVLAFAPQATKARHQGCSP